MPILYSFRRCPYAMRARLALAYAGLAVELREVVLRDKPAELLACSAKATVPVLQLPEGSLMADGTVMADGSLIADGSVIDESVEIMQWALAANDPDGWLASNGSEQAVLIARNDNEFKSALDRYKYPNRYVDDYPQLSLLEIEQQYKQQAEIFINELELRLQAQTFLMGCKVSMADMAILPFIRQFAFVNKAGFDAAPYQHVQRWLQQFLQSELFAQVMIKLPQWHAGDEPIIFAQ